MRYNFLKNTDLFLSINEGEKNFNNQLYEKYLNVIRELEQANLEVIALRNKNEELQIVQLSMFRNDPSANHKSLINRIEELNKSNDGLNEEIVRLKLEKENIYKESGKSEGVLAGVPFFTEVFKTLGCQVDWKFKEGEFLNTSGSFSYFLLDVTIA